MSATSKGRPLLCFCGHHLCLISKTSRKHGKGRKKERKEEKEGRREEEKGRKKEGKGREKAGQAGKAGRRRKGKQNKIHQLLSSKLHAGGVVVWLLLHHTPSLSCHTTPWRTFNAWGWKKRGSPIHATSSAFLQKWKRTYHYGDLLGEEERRRRDVLSLSLRDREGGGRGTEGEQGWDWTWNLLSIYHSNPVPVSQWRGRKKYRGRDMSST